MYAITKLFFHGWDMSLVVFGLGICLVMIQVAGPLLTVLPMIACTSAVYSSERYLFPIVNQLPFGRCKLKYATFYERLHTDRKVTFTVGPLGKVTQKSLFEV